MQHIQLQYMWMDLLNMHVEVISFKKACCLFICCFHQSLPSFWTWMRTAIHPSLVESKIFHPTRSFTLVLNCCLPMFSNTPSPIYFTTCLCLILSYGGCFALEMRSPASGNVYIVTAGETSESESPTGESETARIRVHDPTYLSPVKPHIQVEESLTRSHRTSPRVQLNSRSNSGFLKAADSGNPFRTRESPVVSEEEPDWDSLYKGSGRRAVRHHYTTGHDSRRIVRIQSIVSRNEDSSVGQGEELQTPAVSSDLSSQGTSDPPPHEQVAKMARYIVRNSNWTSVATISTRNPVVGFPFANIFSVSDGQLDGVSSGVPYMYLTPLEISVHDLEVDSRASLTMSLAQGNYCKAHSYDPEDPRCAHVILTGNVVEVLNSTTEAGFARNALFSRHPEMSDWPKDHGWFFAKLNISNILVLDYFGGAKSVSSEDYFNAG